MKSVLGLKLPSFASETKSEKAFKKVGSSISNADAEGEFCEPLKPLLILLDCQRRKSYLSWTDGKNLLLQVGSQSEVLPVTSVALRGTELQVVVEPDANEYDNCVVLDVANGVSPMSWRLEQTSLVLNGGALTLWCRSLEAQAQLRVLYGMCMLARFEYISLYKALTATVISTHGSRISDISAVLLAQHSYKDWCYISIDGEWVKAWCHVDRSPKRPGSRDGRHQIKFYRDDKSLTAKNLLCFIPDCGEVEDLFFVEDQNPNVSKSAPIDGFGDLHFQTHVKGVRNDSDSFESSLEALLSRLTTLRVIGDVYWPSEGADSSGGKTSILGGGSLSPKKVRRNTISSIPDPSTGSYTQHKRSISSVSMSSSVHHPQVSDYDTKTSEIVIKPIPHSGVHHLESLIRCALPMMACLSLYGRPVQFINSREDPNSLLFGLPRLPVVDFFAVQEIQPLFEYVASTAGDSVSLNKTLAAYKLFLSQQLANPHRGTRDFTTLADMVRTGSDFSIFTDSSGSVSNSPLI
ncbi:LAME_0C01926g1_1 [Lachancea meyersii CBS 8951]|uniref:LAME_0C01926g1_1 n=1 Tax=Lachancea meyersii CBS 8951 TaxID=1266667 RepID=A0A1G4IZA3_9SACH|nr:LAME_0C01926g1_1 [Lachancea meyersii CBS 8951]